VVVHLGASQASKAYPAELWADVLSAVREKTDEPITLIGSAEERALATSVVERAGIDRLHDLTGATGIADLFDVIAGAQVLVGADSAPIAIASLTATPAVNLSCDAVNFWETGPVSAGSRVLFEPVISDLAPARVAAEIVAVLEHRPPTGPCAVRASRAEPYQLHDMPDDAFAWHLIEALYAGAPYPETTSSLDFAAFKRLHEVAEVALDQLARWHGPERAAAAQQMSLVDDLLPAIARMNPRVEPLVQWFQTERLRLGPGAADDILTATTKLFRDLAVIAAVYVEPVDRAADLRRAVALGLEIAPRLREYDFASVETSFNELIATLERCGDPTKVGDEGFSTWVRELGDALAARDFIELADRLEHELPRELGRIDGRVLG
jgi:hypothetical protein